MSLNRFEPDINDISIAYLLGIYLTDGYVTKESVRLRVIDKDIAENFAEVGYKLFGKMPIIKKYPNKSKNGYKSKPFYEVHIYSVQLGRWLINITDAKKKIPEFVYNMPIEWKREFLAGILDGDGWCSVSEKRRKNNPTSNASWWASIGFTGKTNTYVEDMEKFFQQTGIDYSYTDRYTDDKDRATMREFRIKTSSFIDNKLYFRCHRKQKRAELIARHNIGQKYNTQLLNLATFND